MSSQMADTAELPRYRPTEGRVRAQPTSASAVASPPRVAPPLAPQAWPSRPIPTLPPVPVVTPPVAAVPAPVILGRAALRAERLALRRERRFYACLGIGTLIAGLGTTIVVLDVFH
jgi:hypothetical protein